MSDDWDRGRWCPICHQKHLQIHPPCLREEQRRRVAALAPLAALLRPELFAERGDPEESAREDERLMANFAPLRRAASACGCA